MEYNSAIIKEWVLSFAMTWMNLEDIILSKTSQEQKNIYNMISLIFNIIKQIT
jgi:hypothetical protein